MICGEPDIVVPVTNLTFEVCAALVAAMPNRAVIEPVSAERGHVTDCTVLDAFDGFDIARMMAALSAGGNLKSLALRCCRCGVHHTCARSVHADGFFHKDVFPCGNGGCEVCRAEAGRCGKDHVVDTWNLQCLHIAIESAETLVCGYAMSTLSFVCCFGEDVSHRNDFGVHSHDFGCIEEVTGCSSSAPTESDDCGL